MVLGSAANDLWPAIRRAIAVVCAVAFLVVTFAHAIEHHPSQPSAKHELALVDGSNQPDTGNSDTDGGHCHGCVMVAAIDLVAPAMEKPERVLAFHEPITLSRISLSADSPYPIANI